MSTVLSLEMSRPKASSVDKEVIDGVDGWLIGIRLGDEVEGG